MVKLAELLIALGIILACQISHLLRKHSTLFNDRVKLKLSGKFFSYSLVLKDILGLSVGGEQSGSEKFVHLLLVRFVQRWKKLVIKKR